MTRRRFLTSIGAGIVTAPALVGAQPPATPYRIGHLGNGSPAVSGHLFDAFRVALRAHGWVEGRDIVIETRYAQGDNRRLEPLARELAALKPHIFFAPTTTGALAVQRVAPTVPTVIALASDPVGDGLIATFAKPGGRITGLASIGVDLVPKRLQLLKECVPALSHIAVLHDASVAYNVRSLTEVRRAALGLGLTVGAVVSASSAAEFDAACAKLAGDKPQGLTVLDNPLFFAQRQALVAGINATRIPAVYGIAEFATAGGLLAYAVNYVDQYRRAAGYVDRILRGTSPADLPVQQPERFDLVVNLATARALGLTLPQSLVVRADRVVE